MLKTLKFRLMELRFKIRLTLTVLEFRCGECRTGLEKLTGDSERCV